MQASHWGRDRQKHRTENEHKKKQGKAKEKEEKLAANRTQQTHISMQPSTRTRAAPFLLVYQAFSPLFSLSYLLKSNLV